MNAVTRPLIRCRRFGVVASALAAALTAVACNDATAPPVTGPAVVIVPAADSVFEGDTVRLAAQVFDDAGVSIPGAPVTWTVNDTTLARVVEDSALALLRPGIVRITAVSGSAGATYDLEISRLLVSRVELTPEALEMGRTDRLPVTVRVLAQGDRPVTGRPITFTSEDSLVAIVVGPPFIGSATTGLVLAEGPGSTTIRASVDGVTGTAQVGVVAVDTTFTLTEYNGSPTPALVWADTVLTDGEQNVYEFDADEGTLVLSGLLQKRYEIDVRYSVYHVTRTGDTVEREFIAQVRGQFDRGVVTAREDGSLSLLSEIIGPHLEHIAVLRTGGYLVHYRIPGESIVLDLGFRLDTP